MSADESGQRWEVQWAGWLVELLDLVMEIHLVRWRGNCFLKEPCSSLLWEQLTGSVLG